MTPHNESPLDLRGEPDVESLEKTWELLAHARPRPVPEPELDRAWAELRTRIDEDESESIRKARQPRWRTALLAAAAVAALALTWDLASTVRVEAGPGGFTTVTLAEGTRIDLNSGSTLARDRWRFPWQEPVREVRLRGEAFFEVSPGEEPFVVETFNARVVVLGTRFNVRAREEASGGTEVALEEGRVRLEVQNEPATGLELQPGQRSTVAAGADRPTPPERSVPEYELAWRERGFAALDRPLHAIVGELERRFDIEIQVMPEVDVNDRLTVHYADPEDPRVIISDIATARGLRFRATRSGFQIY